MKNKKNTPPGYIIKHISTALENICYLFEVGNTIYYSVTTWEQRYLSQLEELNISQS